MEWLEINPPSPKSGSRAGLDNHLEVVAVAKDHKINEQIRVRQVRLIDDEGAQVGIVDTKEAMRMATERNMDLVITVVSVSRRNNKKKRPARRPERTNKKASNCASRLAAAISIPKSITCAASSKTGIK
jgi:succinylarginine dihydrolase